MNRSLKLVSLLGVLLLLSALAFGQAISGDLTGTVRDASGAYVGNSTVEVTTLATGYKQTTHTNNEGEYRFVHLPAGHYSVQVTAAGMKGGLRDVEVTLN